MLYQCCCVSGVRGKFLCFLLCSLSLRYIGVAVFPKCLAMIHVRCVIYQCCGSVYEASAYPMRLWQCYMLCYILLPSSQLHQRCENIITTSHKAFRLYT